nr:hypothetical protein [uncultured Kingella sp.]
MEIPSGEFGYAETRYTRFQAAFGANDWGSLKTYNHYFSMRCL